ncbi:MAG: copper resistance CopC family protein [Pseudonocardia sp.]
MRLSLLIAAGVVGALSLTGPAYAHTDMTASNPAPSAKVITPPRAVSLTFSEPIGTGPATVNVRGPQGDNIAEGKPRANGSTVVQAIAVMTEKGRYQVDYRVVGIDGHPVTGSYTFRFIPRPTQAEAPTEDPSPVAETAAPVVRAPDDQPSPAAATGGDQDGSSGLLIPGIGAGVVALLIGAGALVSRRRREEEPQSS